MNGFGWVFQSATQPRMSVSRFLDVVVVAALEYVVADVGEEPFDLVEPAGVGGGGVHVEAAVGGEPGVDGG